MLQMSPSLIRAQRRKARQEREAMKGRLGRARFDALAKDLARVIRLAFNAGVIGSPLGLEGPLRHGIRADLCLMGWRWRDADAIAAGIVGEALRRVRAVRPTWYEGQPEWTIREGLLSSGRAARGATRLCPRAIGSIAAGSMRTTSA